MRHQTAARKDDRWVRGFMHDGRLVVWLLLAVLALALALEIGIVQRSRSLDRHFAPVPASTLLTATPPPLFSVRTSPRQVQRVRNEVVYRHHVGRPLRADAAFEVATTVAHLRPDRPETTPSAPPPD